MPENLEGRGMSVKELHRFISKAIHPDLVRPHIGDAQIELLNPLITDINVLLDRTRKYPDEEENWGRDINQKYPLGSTVKIFGLSGGENPEFRPPIEITLRAPKDFLKIFYKYLKTGDVSEDLPPPYDPNAAPPEALHIDMEEVDEAMLQDDDPEAPWNIAAAQHELDKNQRELIAAIAASPDYEQCTALRLVTRLYAQHDMRRVGVLKALDAKVEDFLQWEIRQAKTSGAVTKVENRIKEYDFDEDGEGIAVKTRLQEALKKHVEEYGPFYPPPNEYELKAAAAQTIEELANHVRSLEAENSMSPEEKSRTARSIDGYARQLLIKECNRSATLDVFKNILQKTREFPFASHEYGFGVLDAVETRTKYFLLGQILSTKDPQILNDLRPTIDSVQFRTHAHVEDLYGAIEKRKQRLQELS